MVSNPDGKQPENAPQSRPSKADVELAVALAGTLFSALLLVLTAIHAGPLWRDEVNALNVAQMPTFRELWNNLPFESLPPLWLLLLRGLGALGLAESDFAIRILGLFVGLLILVSLWLCARWMGVRAPIMSVGLFGSLPAFVFIAGANRAYGLAACLLVLTFGLTWRLVEAPTRARMLVAGLACLLYAHCVYYDAVVLAAMLAGGVAVALRRRAWKALAALVGIGAVSAGSLAVYAPVIRQGAGYALLWQVPFFWWGTLWGKLGEAVTARSSAELGGRGPEIWVWLALAVVGLAVALVAQWRGKSWKASGEDEGLRVENGKEGTANPFSPRLRWAGIEYRTRCADLALYCSVSMLLGVAGMCTFLYRLHYLTQSWYYLPILVVSAISLDGIFGVNWPVFRPWGLLRVGFMAVMMAWYAKAGWQEAHTRRSDVDLIAALLNQKASTGDLVVVSSAWEGITFNRYYHGAAPWETVPPVDSHMAHRNDLVLEDMGRLEPMSPVLCEITNSLNDGHSVWMVGSMSDFRPGRPPPLCPPIRYAGIYFNYWNAQVSAALRDNALRQRSWEVAAGDPVSSTEDLPVTEFAGYRVAH